MIQLWKSGPRFSESEEDARSLRARFERFHCVKLPNFIAPDFAEYISDRIERSTFYVRDHDEVALELCMATNKLLGLLQLLLNNPELFRTVERITGCGRIASFDGRIYRMLPGGGHYNRWHGDNNGRRLAGLSVNLSRRPYVGGTFEITGDSGTVRRVPNTGFGDAILFPIAEPFRHRLTILRGSVPKTAFAGWFENRRHPHPFLARILDSRDGQPRMDKSA